MKNLILVLVIFIVTSCAIRRETGVPCWKDRICVGDVYKYNKAPKQEGGYYRADVYVLGFKGKHCLIRHANGKEYWVKTKYFDDNNSPIFRRQMPNKNEK